MKVKNMPIHKPIKFEANIDPKILELFKQSLEQNKRVKTVANATLGLVALGGVLTLGVLAPSLFGIVGQIVKNVRHEKKKHYQDIWRSFYRLKAAQAVKFVREEDGQLVFSVTEKGKEKIRKMVWDELRLCEPKGWDRKWRLVIFDIPETKKLARQALTRKLKDIGFFLCQKSVWLHPWPCDHEIRFVADVLNVGPFVKIFHVDKMSDGRTLYHFKDLLKRIA